MKCILEKIGLDGFHVCGMKRTPTSAAAWGTGLSHGTTLVTRRGIRNRVGIISCDSHASQHGLAGLQIILETVIVGLKCGDCGAVGLGIFIGCLVRCALKMILVGLHAELCSVEGGGRRQGWVHWSHLYQRGTIWGMVSHRRWHLDGHAIWQRNVGVWNGSWELR